MIMALLWSRMEYGSSGRSKLRDGEALAEDLGKVSVVMAGASGSIIFDIARGMF